MRNVILAHEELGAPLRALLGDEQIVTTPSQLSSDAESRSLVTLLATYGNQPWDRQALDTYPNLQAIVLYGAGFEGIELTAAQDRRITVMNTPDSVTGDVADLAICLYIAAMRRVVQADRHVRNDQWARREPFAPGSTAGGRRAGIVGLGRIGSAVAHRCAAINLTVSYYSRSAKNGAAFRFQPDLASLARESDVLFICCPGGAGTRNLVSSAIINSMPRHAFLINVARGSIVDQRALVDALSRGAIGGAGLDVFDDEPNVPRELFAMENVVLTPHIGSSTHETRRATIEAMAQVIREFAAGMRSNVIL